MNIIKKMQKLDIVTKIGVIVIIMMVAYIIFLFLLKSVFISEDNIKSHTFVMNDHIMSFVNPEERNLNITSIFLSFIFGFVIWLLVKEKKEEENLKIIKKVLSEDEKKILNEIEKAGEITQDSLRFRLNWSKAKVSAILLQLDRINIIQRERQGKTYKVKLIKQK